MSKDRSEELADWIAGGFLARNEYEFRLKDQFGPRYDEYDYWGSKLLIRHTDGSTYEVVVNPVNDIYDSKFGDDKECKCGHVYYRHFDSYTVTMEPVGCKYCHCEKFMEK